MLFDYPSAIAVAVSSAWYPHPCVKFRACSIQPHLVCHAKHLSLFNAPRANAPEESLGMVPPKPFSSNAISPFRLCFETSWGISDTDKAVKCCFLARQFIHCILEAEILPGTQRNKLIFIDNVNYLDEVNKN